MNLRRSKRFVGHDKKCPYPNLTDRSKGSQNGSVALDWCRCGQVTEELLNLAGVLVSIWNNLAEDDELWVWFKSHG
jgi:hypothetical protein